MFCSVGMGSCIGKCRNSTVVSWSIVHETIVAAPTTVSSFFKLNNSAYRYLVGLEQHPNPEQVKARSRGKRLDAARLLNTAKQGGFGVPGPMISGMPPGHHTQRPARLIGCLSSRCVAQRFRLASPKNRCQGAPEILVLLVVVAHRYMKGDFRAILCWWLRNWDLIFFLRF